jgi:hypothetical protein
MDNKNSVNSSSREAVIRDFDSYRQDTAKRLSAPHSTNNGINTKLPNNKMGQALAIKLINIFGWIFVLLGINPTQILQFNDLVGLVIKIVALGFVIVKLLDAITNYRIKRVEMLEREEDYKSKKATKAVK